MLTWYLVSLLRFLPEMLIFHEKTQVMKLLCCNRLVSLVWTFPLFFLQVQEGCVRCSMRRTLIERSSASMQDCIRHLPERFYCFFKEFDKHAWLVVVRLSPRVWCQCVRLDRFYRKRQRSCSSTTGCLRVSRICWFHSVRSGHSCFFPSSPTTRQVLS